MKKVAVICVLIFCTVTYCVLASALFPTATAQQSSSDRSLLLNGTSAYFSVPNSPSLDITGAITVEAWIKRNANGTQAIVERYSSSSGGYALRIQNDKLQFMTLRNSYEYDFVVGNSAVTTGTWLHVAGVFDGNQLRVYLNGTLDGSKNSIFAPGSGTSNIRIGVVGDGDTDFFNGLIDEVRVTADTLYNVNFGTEVSLIAGGVRSADGANTRGLWKFNDSSIGDSSGTNNNGSLIGGAAFSSDFPTSSDSKDSPVQPSAESTPVFINFDELPGGYVVNNWYQSLGINFHTSQGLVFTRDYYQESVSYPNHIVSTKRNSYGSYDPCYTCDIQFHFSQPVNNLSFNINAFNTYGIAARMQVWQKGVFSGAVPIYGTGIDDNRSSYVPVRIDFRNLQAITASASKYPKDSKTVARTRSTRKA